ncbi:hypothetical protein HDE_09043 [Halotydeus destructor]|nr:hypothetical protein HDE_09043 [Halotydeus destructor]
MHLASLVTVLSITLLGSVSVSGNFHQERIWSRYMRQSLPTEAHHRKQIYKQHPLRQARQNLGILPLLSDPENEAVTLGGPLWFDQTLVDFILRFIVPFSTPIIPDPEAHWTSARVLDDGGRIGGRIRTPGNWSLFVLSGH